MKIIGICEDPKVCTKFVDEIVGRTATVSCDYLVDLEKFDLIKDPRKWMDDRCDAYYSDCFDGRYILESKNVLIVKASLFGKDLSGRLIRYIPELLFKVRE